MQIQYIQEKSWEKAWNAKIHIFELYRNRCNSFKGDVLIQGCLEKILLWLLIVLHFECLSPPDQIAFVIIA